MAAKRVLMVLTSADASGCGGEGSGGFFLSELVHPFDKFTAAGHAVTIASIAGGACHVAAGSLGESFYDEACKAFWEGPNKELTQTTKALEEYAGADFDVLFFVGGFGTMTDFTNSPAVARLGKEVYENNGSVAAVCHGPSALVNITLSDGTYLVAGKTLTAFTNEEEAQFGSLALPDGSCEDLLKARGAVFEGGTAWSSTVKASERVFTGQNPASAGALAEAVIASF